MIKSLLLIGLGGGLGSIARYSTTTLAQKYLSSFLPYGTLIANLLGSFLIGVLIAYLIENPSQNIKLLLVTGFCGGFTTFSTFSYENFSYLQNGQVGMFLLYGMGSLAAGLFFVYLGFSFLRIF
ncbi:putative fluoride ion transporter CrcB [Marivirga tractuosa]|uniref:Fluoride-specific ion channel FluC n=1 Tax=Marivirga tractuosa (strain ATCC 23168 / DSM 4126 / NBRC 15989 / NCIMB 1408 / VKM B-1430 / H-43) TaxID=643867 RepID=E4TMJ0_MARTH|nr:fluoride efflux transporter CrcB [Marivirga tractuosa]ADR23424.1 CrcB protein [Marivirga tractuosa DSM 4126]BDD15901.1 putative fluoride ion transporter CrcB [Marivirga tractuosa]